VERLNRVATVTQNCVALSAANVALPQRTEPTLSPDTTLDFFL
jgi:hypothetical protein